MKQKIIALSIIATLLLSGCQKYSDEDYESLNAAYDSAQAENNTITSEKDSLAADLEALQAEKNSLKNDYDKLVKEYSDLKKEHEDFKANVGDWNELSDTEKAAQIEVAKREDEIKKLDSQKNNKETEVNKLNADIENKKSEIENLKAEINKYNGDLIAAKGQPLSCPAGYLIAGKDFEVGRYKIYGGTSNFVVYSSSGRLRVNTILGDWGVSEYIYEFSYGDEVQAESSFKMVAV